MDNQVTPEQVQAYLQSQKAMAQVAAMMKEIPVLPSEKPEDPHALRKTTFPETGGILTEIEGYDYPYKGFPLAEIVEKLDTIKKVQRGLLSSLFHSLKDRKWKLLLLPWLMNDLARSFIYSAYRVVDRVRIKSTKYCDAVRELHRAFSREWHDETLTEREARFQLRDVICSLLEFDNAYRFRFQDIMVELDKAALRKKPAQEILRLLDLMSTREIKQEVKDTWSLAKFFLPTYLRLNPGFRRQLIAVLTELDLSKIALSPEDQYFSITRLDYVFGFSSNEENPIVQNHKFQKGWQEKKKSIQEKVSLQTAQTVKRHQEERKSLALTDEEVKLIEVDIPLALSQLAQEEQQSIAKLSAEVKAQADQHEKNILLQLPERFRHLTEVQSKERAELDLSNTALLKNEEELYHNRKKLKE